MVAKTTTAAALCFALAGCSTHPAPAPAPAPAPVVVDTPMEPSTPLPEPEQPPAVPAIERPACRLGPQRGDVRGRLRLAVESQVFADFAGEVDLERLELGSDRRAHVVVDDGRVRLEADVAPGTLRLAPTDGAPVDGWLTIHAGRVAAVEPGMVTLAVKVPRFEPAGELPPLRFPCERLSAVAPSSDRKLHHDRLKEGVRAPLQPSLGEAPVGYLIGPEPSPPGEPSTFTLALEVLETRGPSTRVRFDGHEASVTGWIPTSTVNPKGVGLLLGALGGMGGGGDPHAVTCDRDVPLQVAVAGRRFTVGTLHADASLPLATSDPGDWEVLISDDLIVSLLQGTSSDGLHAFVAPTHRRYCERSDP